MTQVPRCVDMAFKDMFFGRGGDGLMAGLDD